MIITIMVIIYNHQEYQDFWLCSGLVFGGGLLRTPPIITMMIMIIIIIIMLIIYDHKDDRISGPALVWFVVVDL